MSLVCRAVFGRESFSSPPPDIELGALEYPSPPPRFNDPVFLASSAPSFPLHWGVGGGENPPPPSSPGFHRVSFSCSEFAHAPLLYELYRAGIVCKSCWVAMLLRLVGADPAAGHHPPSPPPASNTRNFVEGKRRRPVYLSSPPPPLVGWGGGKEEGEGKRGGRK